MSVELDTRTENGTIETRIVHRKQVMVTLRDWTIRDRSDYYATAHIDPTNEYEISSAYYSRGMGVNNVPASFVRQLAETMQGAAREAIDAADPTDVLNAEHDLRERGASRLRELAASAFSFADECRELARRLESGDEENPHAMLYASQFEERHHRAS